MSDRLKIRHPLRLHVYMPKLRHNIMLPGSGRNIVNILKETLPISEMAFVRGTSIARGRQIKGTREKGSQRDSQTMWLILQNQIKG